jgi:hypothetical protein
VGEIRGVLLGARAGTLREDQVDPERRRGQGSCALAFRPHEVGRHAGRADDAESAALRDRGRELSTGARA